MQKGNNMAGIIATVVAVLVIGGIIVWALSAQQPQPAPTTDTQETTTEQTPVSDETASSLTIVYTDDGFSPESYIVKAGTPVTVKNNSSSALQFSSDDHPTHTKDSELNLEMLEAGESTTFTPSRTGTWGFHDHLNAGNTGTLTVE